MFLKKYRRDTGARIVKEKGWGLVEPVDGKRSAEDVLSALLLHLELTPRIDVYVENDGRLREKIAFSGPWVTPPVEKKARVNSPVPAQGGPLKGEPMQMHFDPRR